MDPPTERDGPVVSLTPMTQQLEVRQDGDDWTGVTSTAERRKLQNRLNQRASRRRKRRLDAVLARRGGPSHLEMGETLHDDSDGNPVAPGHHLPCTMDDPARRAMLSHFASEAHVDYASGIPRLLQLPTLVKLNVFNALARNAAALGLMNNEWVLCDAVSPFGRAGPLGPRYKRPGSINCPPSLQPTKLQLTVQHRPWIDLFPLPRLRDNLLTAMTTFEAFDELGLCFDMVEAYGTTTSSPEDPLLLVWGEPWDPYGWEASVAFLKKWGRLLRGCYEILESTNYWRERRGERKLFFGDL